MSRKVAYVLKGKDFQDNIPIVQTKFYAMRIYYKSYDQKLMDNESSCLLQVDFRTRMFIHITLSTNIFLSKKVQERGSRVSFLEPVRHFCFLEQSSTSDSSSNLPS